MAGWVSVRVIGSCIAAAAIFALVFFYLGLNDPTDAHANTASDKCQTTVGEIKKLAVEQKVPITVPAQLSGSYYIQCAYVQDEGRFMNASLFYHQSSQFMQIQQKPAIAEFIGSGGIVISILKEDIPEDDPTFNNKMLHAESELMLFTAGNPEAELRYVGTNPAVLTRNAQSPAANDIILYLDGNAMLVISGPLPHGELLKISESMSIE